MILKQRHNIYKVTAAYIREQYIFAKKKTHRKKNCGRKETNFHANYI